MIRIWADGKGDKRRLYAAGHAEFSKGPDVVCAAVSALVLTLMLYADKKGTHVRHFTEKGKAFLSCHGIGEVFDAVLTGLAALAAQYPENLCLCQGMAVNDKREKV